MWDFNYTANLTEKIRVLPCTSKIMFALHCSKRLMDKHGDKLRVFFNAEEIDILFQCLDQVWKSLPEGDPETDPTSKAKQLIENFDQNSDSLDEASSLKDFLAIEVYEGFNSFLDTFKTCSTESAVDSANHVLNALDYIIQDDENYDGEYYEHPIFVQELQRQYEALKILEVEPFNPKTFWHGVFE